MTDTDEAHTLEDKLRCTSSDQNWESGEKVDKGEKGLKLHKGQSLKGPNGWIKKSSEHQQQNSLEYKRICETLNKVIGQPLAVQTERHELQVESLKKAFQSLESQLQDEESQPEHEESQPEHEDEDEEEDEDEDEDEERQDKVSCRAEEKWQLRDPRLKYDSPRQVKVRTETQGSDESQAQEASERVHGEAECESKCESGCELESEVIAEAEFEEQLANLVAHERERIDLGGSEGEEDWQEDDHGRDRDRGQQPRSKGQPQPQSQPQPQDEWNEPQMELPSLRNYCSRCWSDGGGGPALGLGLGLGLGAGGESSNPDCTFIHPSGDIYQHEEPNLPVLPCTLSSPKKVTEEDCKWFHALESKTGSGGGVDIVLKCLNWPFSLSPEFVDVAVELLDYCLQATDPGDCGSSYSSLIKLKIYAKEKEKSMVLLFDEVWTKMRNNANLKAQLPNLSLIFLKFLFSSDGKLSEAIVTLKKVLEDDSSKDLDKEQFAMQFCDKLDQTEGRYGEKRSKYDEDNLLGKLKLMTKLATLFGVEIAEKYFLPRFIALASHKAYEVRRLCVYRIHEMVYAVSEAAVETALLPAFLKLCHDKETEVRSPCLLGMIALSSKLPMRLRITVLAPVYYKLLKWQNALSEEMLFLTYFPTFCPFITTLAHQPIAVLELNHDCDVVLSYLNDSEFGFEMNFCLTSFSKGGYWSFDDNHCSFISAKDTSTSSAELDSPSSPKNELEGFRFPNRVEEYKSFDYWREPVDDCYIHSEVIDIMSDKWTENLESMQEFWNKLNSEEDGDGSSPVSTSKSIRVQFCQEKSALKAKYENLDLAEEEENVNSLVSSMLVSSMLVKYYLSEKRLRWVTTNIAAESLAIFLPAVALTLGQRNWHLLKSAFVVLATHEEWKIRLAIASIIHELALLLTKVQTEEDLLPIFKSIMEDLDPVRLGALRNMASFLGSLNSSARTTFLTRFSDFLGPDFRLREVLVDQLISVLPLFSACDIITFILPFVILVLQDKIAAVRQKAVNLACELSLHVYMEEKQLTYNVLKKFTEHLASSSEWRHRQTYAILAAALCVREAAGPKSLDQVVFPHLFNLCSDKVVNVRIAVARSLRDIVLSNNIPFAATDIQRALSSLSSDEDPDVRELSCVEAPWWPSQQ